MMAAPELRTFLGVKFLKPSYPYYLGKTPVTSDDKPLNVIDKFTQQVRSPFESIAGRMK